MFPGKDPWPVPQPGDPGPISGGAVAEAQVDVPLSQDGNEVMDPRTLRQRAVRLARLFLERLLWHPATEPRDEAFGYLTGERVFWSCVWLCVDA